MRQHYTLLGIAMLVSGSALAATQHSSLMQRDLSNLGQEQTATMRSRQVKPRQQAPTMLPEDLNFTEYDKYSWTNIGKAVYCDNFISSIYTYSNYGPETEWEVDVESCNNIKGLYRLVNPYGEGCPYAYYNPTNPNDPYNTYDPTTDHYIYVHTERQDQTGYSNMVWIDNSLTTARICQQDLIDMGFPEGTDFGTFEVSSVARSYYLDKDMALLEAFKAGQLGTHNNGVIEFPVNSLLVRLTNKAEYFQGSEKKWAVANQDGTARIKLPGSIDYSIKVEAPQLCAKKNKVAINLFHDKQADIRFKAFKGRLDIAVMNDIEFEDLAYDVADNGILLDKRSESVIVDAPEDGIYTVFFVTVDEAGDPRVITYEHIFGHNDDSDNWESLGNTIWREDILSRYLSYATPGEEIEAEIQVNKDCTMLRLKNPYANYSLAKYSTHPTDHNHYLKFYLSNLDRVEMPYAALDYASDNAQLVAGDFVEYYRRNTVMNDDQIAENGLFGQVVTLANGEKWIEFNQTCIVSRYLHLRYDGIWHTSNENTKFGVKIPAAYFELREDSGVDNIVAPVASETEYFNLQGVKISDPQPGQIVIKRTGEKVSKEIIK